MTTKMKLTGRQRQFLRCVRDLHEESGQPLHYSAVAERLGVSGMTAYDMLRVLEERGLLVSEYVLPEQGPGRSTIVFRPSQQAMASLALTAGGEGERGEWEMVKGRILQALHEARGTDYQELLDRILQRIPERRSPTVYVTEMVTAVLLHLHQLKGEVKDSNLLENLRALGLPGEVAGLTVGLSFVEKANRHITSTLLSYSRKYQEYLARLSSESRQLLSDFAEEVIAIVET